MELEPIRGSITLQTVESKKMPEWTCICKKSATTFYLAALNTSYLATQSYNAFHQSKCFSLTENSQTCSNYAKDRKPTLNTF